MNIHAGNYFCYSRKTSFKHLERKDKDDSLGYYYKDISIITTVVTTAVHEILDLRSRYADFFRKIGWLVTISLNSRNVRAYA